MMFNATPAAICIHTDFPTPSTAQSEPNFHRHLFFRLDGIPSGARGCRWRMKSGRTLDRRVSQVALPHSLLRSISNKCGARDARNRLLPPLSPSPDEDCGLEVMKWYGRRRRSLIHGKEIYVHALFLK